MNRSIRRTGLRLLLVLFLMAAISIILPSYQEKTSRFGFVAQPAARPALKAMRGPGLHTIYAREDGVGCRLATREELNTLLKRDPNQRLHVISPIRTFNLSPAETGLTIVLRGTEQLHGFPEAENAFNRAKALWESLIQTPITVIVDVDFGPTRFGQPYPQGVLGSTDSQDLGADGIYPDVRAALIAGASNPQEAAIYNSLPANTIPTDRGDVAFMIGPSSVFRALGFISAVADPDAEQEDFGDPPSIGFNSNFTYDFNPDDGIAPGSIDFDAVAVHELGHVLGFVSNVGLGEISDSLPDAASVWDLFRLRPGATSDSFSSALRILTPGGEQSQFVSGLEVPQSTGRVNGTGGDGEQSSHWKDDIFINRFIGIMDPTLNIGEREQISSHDIAAIDLFGYTINPAMVTNLAPESGTFQAAIDVTSQTLVVSGAATDANSDIVEARLDLVDDLNRVVAQITSPLSNTDGSRIVSFNLQFPNLNQFSAIRRAMLTVADSEDRRSRVVPADVFFDNDPNRPTITVVNRKGKKLIIKGRGFTGGVRVEVNGLVVAPPINIGGSAKKIKIKGTDALLNLNSGPNRIRVISGNIRSDVATLNL